MLRLELNKEIPTLWINSVLWNDILIRIWLRLGWTTVWILSRMFKLKLNDPNFIGKASEEMNLFFAKWCYWIAMSSYNRVQYRSVDRPVLLEYRLFWKSIVSWISIIPGTGTHYGPILVKFEINGTSYKFPIYEAEIQRDCLIGLNFIQNFYCIIDPVACKMAIHSRSYNLIDLKKSKNPTLTLFHTGYLYFTVRTSTVLNLQPGEEQRVCVNFAADCDITSTKDVPRTKSPRASMLDIPCNNDTEVRKLQEEVCQSSFCARRVQNWISHRIEDRRVEFPDGSSDELGEVSGRPCWGSTSDNAYASSVVRRSSLKLLNASKDNSLCGKSLCGISLCVNSLCGQNSLWVHSSLCGTLDFTHLCNQSDHNSTRNCWRICSRRDSRKRRLKVNT